MLRKIVLHIVHNLDHDQLLQNQVCGINRIDVHLFSKQFQTTYQ